jgi:hypothetical protein
VKYFLVVLAIVWVVFMTLMVIGLANDMWSVHGLIARFGRQ